MQPKERKSASTETWEFQTQQSVVEVDPRKRNFRSGDNLIPSGID